MMWKPSTAFICCLATIALAGCGGPDQPAGTGNPSGENIALEPSRPASATPATPAGENANNVQTKADAAQLPEVPAHISSDPAAITHAFLESVRQGEQPAAIALLSTAARERNANNADLVNLPASDTARYEIGKPVPRGEDRVWVPSAWIDIGREGTEQRDEMVWVVCKETAGWRIAGVALDIFHGEELLLLDFENPDDYQAKIQWAREEIARRAEATREIGPASRPIRQADAAATPDAPTIQ